MICVYIQTNAFTPGITASDTVKAILIESKLSFHRVRIKNGPWFLPQAQFFLPQTFEGGLER